MFYLIWGHSKLQSQGATSIKDFPNSYILEMYPVVNPKVRVQLKLGVLR